MAIYALERSFLLKNSIFRIFGHFEFKYKKVREVLSCTNLICKLSLLMSKNNFEL